MRTPIRSLAVLAATAALGLGAGVPAAVAKHGADDPVTHDRGDDHGGKRARSARHGDDDHGRHHHRHAHGARHHGRHGADDPAGHR
jgi:hypothetical protein